MKNAPIFLAFALILITSHSYSQDANATQVAEQYMDRMKTDKINGTIWSICATAAMYRSKYSEAEAKKMTKQLVLRLKNHMKNQAVTPCPDAISQDLWDDPQQNGGINIIKTRYFNGEVGKSMQNPVGLKVTVMLANPPNSLVHVYEAGGPGYWKKPFRFYITVENIAAHDVAVYDWKFNAVCPMDNMGRTWDAASMVPVMVPYIPGDIYIVLKPGDKKRFFSVTTDFYWCLPKDQLELVRDPELFQALITCGAILNNTNTTPGASKKPGNYNPPGNNQPQLQSPDKLDKELEKLIAEYKKLVQAKKMKEADKLKKEILEITGRAYPSKLQEVASKLGVPNHPQPGKPATPKAAPLEFGKWLFIQSDKALQRQIALVKQVGDTGYLRIRIRINKEDDIFCKQYCTGYIWMMSYDDPTGRGKGIEHHFYMSNNYSAPYYELPFDVPVLIKQYSSTVWRYWDKEKKELMYNSNGTIGMVAFSWNCVDDYDINKRPRTRCNEFKMDKAIMIE